MSPKSRIPGPSIADQMNYWERLVLVDATHCLCRGFGRAMKLSTLMVLDEVDKGEK